MSIPDNTTYCVFLKTTLPPSEVQFFEGFCFKLKLPQGESLLFFACDEIDVSHHNYIEMKIFHPSEGWIWPLRVPHQYVLLIDSAEKKKSIGFYATE